MCQYACFTSNLVKAFAPFNLNNTSSTIGNLKCSRCNAAFKGYGSIQILKSPLGFSKTAIWLTHFVDSFTREITLRFTKLSSSRLTLRAKGILREGRIYGLTSLSSFNSQCLNHPDQK